MSYLVDVSLRKSEVGDEAPAAQQGQEEPEAEDIRARSVPDGSVKVRIVMKLFSVVFNGLFVGRVLRVVESPGAVDVRGGRLVLTHLVRTRLTWA